MVQIQPPQPAIIQGQVNCLAFSFFLRCMSEPGYLPLSTPATTAGLARRRSLVLASNRRASKSTPRNQLSSKAKRIAWPFLFPPVYERPGCLPLSSPAPTAGLARRRSLVLASNRRASKSNPRNQLSSKAKRIAWPFPFPPVYERAGLSSFIRSRDDWGARAQEIEFPFASTSLV